MRKTRPFLALAAGCAAAVALAVAAPAALADPAPSQSDNQSDAQAAPDINVEDVKAHLAEFQGIADANDGNRSAGSAGYTASAEYVQKKLTDAGYEVEMQECGSCTSPDPNVIADFPGGDDAQTIMLGAHLDSVSDGPGINDNATGSAGLLQVALALAEAKPELTKHVRFGWWADEEQGLNGSAHYVDNGGAEGVEQYLNFDMIGSPNPGYFLMGDTDSPGAEALSAHLTELKLEPEETQECCSDDGSFADAGVPATGLFTGAGATMTEEQATKWDGEAGKAYDECYHADCDVYPDNVDEKALDTMTDSIAVGLWQLAVKA